MIKELDDLYDDITYHAIKDRILTSDNEERYLKYEELRSKISLRETTINKLLRRDNNI